MLTPTQIAQYLASGGVRCPYCFSTDLTGGFIETDAGIARQDISCGSCHRSWTDLYSLVTIYGRTPENPNDQA